MISAKASLIVSIYNNIAALKAVLHSIQNQTVNNFEVIISEDAEHPEVKSFIEKFNYKGELIHLTQPDNGWQKNLALNNAIKASNSDYLIFIDGDCVLHPKFIEYHLKLADSKTILGGKRIKLDEMTSQNLLNETLSTSKMNTYLLKNYSKLKKQGARFIEEGFFIHPQKIFGFIPRLRRMHQLKGCNMSFPKHAIYDINGFDEDYTRPAIGEDIDLTWRFQRAGYQLKSVRNLAVQYHLYHKENWTDQTENILMMNTKKEQNLFVCKNGLIKN
jgi:cellulose synthase/poly-beta-1,6-N-acetylglucosamine synthase-like glycosyltransferase